MPFRIGLSGLQAAAADLQVTGNNIANTATVGFKQSRAEFADVYAQAYGGISKTAIGSGVRLGATTQQFSQGNIEYTENSLDLAINGQGFFVLNDDGGRSYTRAGQFQVDRDGFVVNSNGQHLQVYPPNETGVTDTTFNTGTLDDLKLEFGDNAPAATESVDAAMNLVSDAMPPVDSKGAPITVIDVDDPNTFNYSTSVTVYDSLGTPRTMTLYYLKLGTGTGTVADPVKSTPGEWKVYAELDGLIPGKTPDASQTKNIFFDSNGNLDTTKTTGLPWKPKFDLATNYLPNNGATIGYVDTTKTPPVPTNEVSIDIADLTQYGTKYSVSDLSQDGFTTGRLTGFDVDQTGVVFARYSNGQSGILGKVALANFKNPQGLQQLGDNNWAETFAAGDPTFGDPGTSNLGLIQSGGLEAANVDLAEELVSLITAQRNYQANAQTISTADQITQTIINIR
ncbi:flagellar hook protein FlgE [Thiocystis violacea]|uniref:flagellar hook protein FlgE n=1 Tax=Thiocystis violacea TaxID=13725 RepID=UPI0019067D52|nr:flagellar hook protein FlgE [Thiocystis violacea]MBK1716739.1 flagellar hook protein FlgE [Thiocystis violacea]